MAILSAFDFTAEHLYEFCMDNKMYSEDCYYLLANAGIIGIPCVSLQVMCIPAPIAGFLLGGGVIHDFALTMSLGVVIGTFSSVFVSNPILLLLGDTRQYMVARKKVEYERPGEHGVV